MTAVRKWKLPDEVEAIRSEVTAWRRHMHENPELSFEETETTDFLIRKLEEIGCLSILRPTPTGVVAVLRGEKSGKGRTIAIRADIDALPIQEETGLPFASRKEGVMHACGHDGHAAILLGAAKLLAARKDSLCGEVRFLFQHAEEKPPGGAVQMLEAGVMDGVDELYGFHLSSSFPTGTFGVRKGALTSATDRFELTITGSEGHSAFPEMCVDAVVTAAQTVTALQTIVSRRVAAAEPCVVSVCEIHGGNVYNIIPGEVKIVGAVRTFSEKTREAMPGMIRQIAEGVCASAGASCALAYQKGYASVVNDPALTDIGRRVIGRTFGEEAVLEIGPLMPGEDFSALQKNCPGFFVELGAGNEEKGCTYPHHNRFYRMDEDALPYGTAYLTALVRDRLADSL